MAPSVALEREQFKHLIGQIARGMTLSDVESLVGQKFTAQSLNQPSILDWTSSKYIYYVLGPASYEIDYVQFSSPKDGIWFNMSAQSVDLSDADDKTCLSVEDLQADAEGSGWDKVEPFIDGFKHGFNTRKGSLTLRVEAIGGGGEHMSLTEEQSSAHTWGLTGCVEDMTIG